MSTALGTAWLLGLFGSVHCIGMCGGLSAALAFAMPASAQPMRKLLLLACMGAGRIASYATLGAVGGALLPTAGEGGFTILRILAGLLLVLMGLSIGGWNAALAPLERAGHRAWQSIGPRALKVARLDSIAGALAAGAAWGWLPCGLVYSALAWSASSGEALPAAALMAAFGVGTLPAVVASGALAARLRRRLQQRGLRIVVALLVVAFGIWTLTVPLMHANHASEPVSTAHPHHDQRDAAERPPHHQGHGGPGQPHQKR